MRPIRIDGDTFKTGQKQSDQFSFVVGLHSRGCVSGAGRTHNHQGSRKICEIRSNCCKSGCFRMEVLRNEDRAVRLFQILETYFGQFLFYQSLFEVPVNVSVRQRSFFACKDPASIINPWKSTKRCCPGKYVCSRHSVAQCKELDN